MLQLGFLHWAEPVRSRPGSAKFKLTPKADATVQIFLGGHAYHMHIMYE